MRSMVFAKLWPMDTNAPRLTPNLKVSPVFHGKSITNQDKGKGQKGTLNALLTTLITPVPLEHAQSKVFLLTTCLLTWFPELKLTTKPMDTTKNSMIQQKYHSIQLLMKDAQSNQASKECLAKRLVVVLTQTGSHTKHWMVIELVAVPELTIPNF